MTARQAGGVALAVAGSETAAWLLFVPSTVMLSTFLLLNAMVLSMFVVGLASAANGVSTRSVTQLLHELEAGKSR